MKVIFKITGTLLKEIHKDLKRPHLIAHERMGFLSCRTTKTSPDTLVILAQEYHPICDDNYLNDQTVGACMNEAAVRNAMQIALSNNCSIFHVHMHLHNKVPQFSRIDIESNHKFVPDFFNVVEKMPHGAIVFSLDKAKGLVWIAKEQSPISVDEFVVVGVPLSIWQPENISNGKIFARDFSRQSFLGSKSEKVLSQVKIGVVGLGGGGSHAVQQLAHAGITRYVICDPDRVENSNLNRLVGATINDAETKLLKIDIAKRVINGLISNPEIHTQNKWQSGLLNLAECHAVLGCVDSFEQRGELERFCRRNLIPYIDIGMVVSEMGASFHISGQVALSVPDGHCLKCMSILRDNVIAAEIREYGKAGPRPQVVWSNGVLASSAVGILISLLCPWHRDDFPNVIHLEYNGNENTLKKSPTCKHLTKACQHYSREDIGYAF